MGGSDIPSVWSVDRAAVAVLIVALSVTAATVFAGPRVDGPRIGGTVLTPASAKAQLLVGNWSSGNSTVSVACPACASTVPTGGLQSFAVKVVPHCAKFGCSGAIEGVSVDLPLLLVNVTPSIPAALPPGGLTVQVMVRIPGTGGAYFLNGSVTTPAPPGPVVVQSQQWTARNASNGTGGLRIAPVLATPDLPGGSVFNESVLVNNSLEPFEDVLNVSVAAPFLLVATGPAFPLELNINQTGTLDLRIRAPTDPGNYTLQGTVFDRPHPLVYVASVNVSFTGITAGLDVASVAGVPGYSLAGADLNGSVLLDNPTNRSHVVALNRTTGAAWFFVNGTPNGSFAIPAGQSVRYYFTLLVKVPPGSYPLGLVFQVLSDLGSRVARPGRLRRRRALGALPGPVPSRCGPGPGPGPGRGPRRRPG